MTKQDDMCARPWWACYIEKDMKHIPTRQKRESKGIKKRGMHLCVGNESHGRQMVAAPVKPPCRLCRMWVELETTFPRISFLVWVQLKVSQRGSSRDTWVKSERLATFPNRFSVCYHPGQDDNRGAGDYPSVSCLFHSAPSLLQTADLHFPVPPTVKIQVLKQTPCP